MMALDLNAKSKADSKQKVESKPIVENKVAGEGETKGKSRKLWILLGALGFVLIAAGVAFFAFPYFKGNHKSFPGTEEGTVQAKSKKVKAALALEPFLVNLADTDEIRFVKTTFQLGLAEEPKEEIKGPAIAAMRDSIISLLSSKTAEQILSPQGKDKLREEIRSRVNAITPEAKVLEVYIVDFVVQL